MTTKGNTCCFTGHRSVSRYRYDELKTLLKSEILRLCHMGVTRFVSGGALGFDLLAADGVLELKQDNPEINLCMAIACKNQEKYWTVSEKNRFYYILNMADNVTYITDEYRDGCMLERNRHMVDASSFCIAYLIQRKGGTLYTVNYAKKQGLDVINLAEQLIY